MNELRKAALETLADFTRVPRDASDRADVLGAFRTLEAGADADPALNERAVAALMERGFSEAMAIDIARDMTGYEMRNG